MNSRGTDFNIWIDRHPPPSVPALIKKYGTNGSSSAKRGRDDYKEPKQLIEKLSGKRFFHLSRVSSYSTQL
jgi:hypothetical protein